MGEIMTDLIGVTDDGVPFHLWLGEKRFPGVWAWEQWAYGRNPFYLKRKCC